MNFEIEKKQTTTFSNTLDHTTSFAHTQTSAWLISLWNHTCGMRGTDTGPANTRGLCTLETGTQRYEAGDFLLLNFESGSDRVDLCWSIGDTGLLWRSHWHMQPDTGIWSRCDRLENPGSSTVEIRRCLARIPLSPGRYEVYTQSSNWARENQGHWNEFFGGILTLRSHSGRTTQITTPYLFIRETGSRHGIAFHILPRGNWVIHLDRTSTTRDELSPFNVIELGLSDHTLQIRIEPGATIELPEILIQDVPSSLPEDGSVFVHQYLLSHHLHNSKTAPVVYNTWFDRFDTLNLDRLRTQLAMAQKIGCEIFTVDAGWYGRGRGDWHRQVGDWQEKLDSAFHGEMRQFAQEVRSAGLGFGLWVEPERNSPEAPIVQEHPDWFVPGVGGFLYPDLSQAAAYRYIYTLLSELTEKYQLAWMKVDFNFELGTSRDELYGYFGCWYQLVDELRANFPNTFFEGCASGGMRLDLSTLSHFDGHFLSDTVNPVDVLRITQGAMLRLPPGRINKWAVLRGFNDQVLTPGGGSWDHAITAEVDFICRAALPGMFGLSGDLTELTPDALSRLQKHIAFYQHWSGFIHDSVCHLLTHPSSIDDRSGWISFQLENSSLPGIFLLFVYRLLDGLSSKSIHPRNIDRASVYQVTNFDIPDSPGTLPGQTLYCTGLDIPLPNTNSAAIYIIQDIGRS